MNVFLLGSCRIHRPMKALHKVGKINLMNVVDPCWFTHSARAARQSLEIICGQNAPPLHLKELFFETAPDREIKFHAPDLVDKADIIIVEVCTLKSIDIEGWDVNAHLVRHAQRNEDPRIASAVRKMTTAEEISEEIRLISEISSKDVMVINHISLTGNLQIDQARRIVTDTIKKANNFTDFTFFDTQSVLNKFPVKTALEDQNHYNKDFERIVGEAIYSHIMKM